MKFNNISLPYPVLGNNDDVYPLLDDDCMKMADPVKTPTEYIFHIDLSQRNKEIASLITSGKAEYACEVSCNTTFLRRCEHSSEPHFEIHLARTDVNGRINFQCFIAAKEPILGYSNKDFNEDYHGFSFDLDKGDLLVVFPAGAYNTNIKYDKLFAAGSFMQIVEAAEGIERTWFNLDENNILIELPHDLFEQYKRIGNLFPEVIHSSLVHNALVYALTNLSEYADSGKTWSDSLIQRLQEPEFQQYDIDTLSKDFNQAYKLADELLQDPYKRLLDSLEKLNDKLNGDTEE